MSQLLTVYYNAQYHYYCYQWWWNTYVQLLHLQSTENNQLCECFEGTCCETAVEGDNYSCYRDGVSTEVSPSKSTPFYETETHSFTEEETLIPNKSEINEDENSKSKDTEDFEMEIDERFVKFLEQSRQHREERDKIKRKQKEDQDSSDDYIEVGSIKLNTTTLPPSEKPGTSRTNEMKMLYGKDFSRIQQLETILQLRYDKNCDIRQPVYWPSIPLKF